MPPALPHVKTGRLRALAVASARRTSLLPDLPTTAETGARGVEASSWNGVLVPAGTPREIIARLHAELSGVMKLPEIGERLAAAGVEPMLTRGTQRKISRNDFHPMVDLHFCVNTLAYFANFGTARISLADLVN